MFLEYQYLQIKIQDEEQDDRRVDGRGRNEEIIVEQEWGGAFRSSSRTSGNVLREH